MEKHPDPVGLEREILLFREEGLQGKKPVQQEHTGDQRIREGVFGDRQGEDVDPCSAENQTQAEITQSFPDGKGCFRLAEVFSFLLELPPPAQDIVGLPDPGKQPAIFHQAGAAVHAVGVSLAVGKTAIEAQPVILPLS